MVWSTDRADWLVYCEQSLNTIPLYVALHLSTNRFQNNIVTRRHIRLRNLPKKTNLKNCSPVPVRYLYAQFIYAQMYCNLPTCAKGKKMDKRGKETVHTCHRGLIRRSELVSSVNGGANRGWARGLRDAWMETNKSPTQRMLKTDNPLFNKHMHTEPNNIYETENDCT